MASPSELRLPTSSAKRQAQNKALWNSTRSADTADFFTLGYSGRSFEDIIDLLTQYRVSTLIDVRTNAVSMYRPEFSKRNLAAALADRSIEYDHRPQFGIPRDIRAKAIGTGSRDILWDWYDTYVSEIYIGSNLHRFFNTMEHPSVLMCSEFDPTECHRHRLCLHLEKLGLHGFDL
jgi:uncharacterized protein (DUF488 family)